MNIMKKGEAPWWGALLCARHEFWTGVFLHTTAHVVRHTLIPIQYVAQLFHRN